MVRLNRCSKITKADIPSPTVSGSRLAPASVAASIAAGRLSPRKMIW